MESVAVERTLDADPGAVCAAIADVEPFMRAAGFDEVSVEGDRLRIAKAFGLARIRLSLRLLDEPDAALAYEQVEGIFEEMTTCYSVAPADGGALVRARTDFSLGGIVGSLLDATVVKRQRRREIEAQFDYLEAPP